MCYLFIYLQWTALCLTSLILGACATVLLLQESICILPWVNHSSFLSGWSHSDGAVFWELCCCANIADESSTGIFWSASPWPVWWELTIQHSLNILSPHAILTCSSIIVFINLYIYILMFHYSKNLWSTVKKIKKNARGRWEFYHWTTNADEWGVWVGGLSFKGTFNPLTGNVHYRIHILYHLQEAWKRIFNPILLSLFWVCGLVQVFPWCRTYLQTLP